MTTETERNRSMHQYCRLVYSTLQDATASVGVQFEELHTHMACATLSLGNFAFQSRSIMNRMMPCLLLLLCDKVYRSGLRKRIQPPQPETLVQSARMQAQAQDGSRRLQLSWRLAMAMGGLLALLNNIYTSKLSTSWTRYKAWHMWEHCLIVNTSKGCPELPSWCMHFIASTAICKQRDVSYRSMSRFWQAGLSSPPNAQAMQPLLTMTYAFAGTVMQCSLELLHTFCLASTH